MVVEAMFLAMAPVAQPPPIFVPGTAVNAPAAGTEIAPAKEQTPEWELRQAARNLFELIAKPDPRYATFVRFTDGTRVWLVLDRGGGLADNRMFEGQAARDFLASMFGPDSGASMTFSPPETEIDGPFGRVKMAITVREDGEVASCGTAYLDALLVAPGSWAKASPQGVWQFTQITLSFGQFRKCTR